MIKEICLEGEFCLIHSITKCGGGGKSKFNNENIDIYNRFDHNINNKPGLATSVFKNISSPQKSFGSCGILIYDGKINNVNSSDAGSIYDDVKNIWETTEGIQEPNKDQFKDVIQKSINGFVEINIYEYNILGLFLKLTDMQYLISQIQSLSDFYLNTSKYNLPYYGLTEYGLIEINVEHLKSDDYRRISDGNLITVNDIYQKKYLNNG